MDTELSHYTIDDCLKRYSKALVHLSQCSSKTFDNVLAYVKKHSLYQDALRIFKDQREEYDVWNGSTVLIFRTFSATMLTTSMNMIDLGMLASVILISKPLLIAAYELVGRKEDAVSAYMKAGMWRECLNVAYTIPMASPDIALLADRLAESLIERRQFIDAARLYIDYGTDDTAVESAIKALAKGYHFTEAMRVVMLFFFETDSG